MPEFIRKSGELESMLELPTRGVRTIRDQAFMVTMEEAHLLEGDPRFEAITSRRKKEVES